MAYVDLNILITWSAKASFGLLFLGRLNRLEINPTGPPVAYRRASLRTWRESRAAEPLGRPDEL